MNHYSYFFSIAPSKRGYFLSLAQNRISICPSRTHETSTHNQFQIFKVMGSFLFCFVSWNATVIGKISPRPPPSHLHPKIKILHNFEGKVKILHDLQRGQLSKSSEEKRPQDVLQSVLQKPTQAKEDECCCKHDNVCLIIPKINLIFFMKTGLTINYMECITYGSLSYVPCHLLIPIVFSTQKRWVV